MKTFPTLAVLLLAGFAAPIRAEPVHELSQSELRASVAAGQSRSVGQVLGSVSQIVAGKPIKVRAFASERVYYFVLLLQSSGAVASVVVDAKTAEVLLGDSTDARKVRDAARQISLSAPTATLKPNAEKSDDKASGSDGDTGHSNAGGNGKGNSGGNGNGNKGGNGNSGQNNKNGGKSP